VDAADASLGPSTDPAAPPEEQGVWRLRVRWMLGRGHPGRWTLQLRRTRASAAGPGAEQSASRAPLPLTLPLTLLLLLLLLLLLVVVLVVCRRRAASASPEGSPAAGPGRRRPCLVHQRCHPGTSKRWSFQTPRALAKQIPLQLNSAARSKAARPKAARPKAARPKAARPKAARPRAARPRAAASAANATGVLGGAWRTGECSGGAGWARGRRWVCFGGCPRAEQPIAR